MPPHDGAVQGGAGPALTAKWERVAAGEKVPWDEVFAGYRSTVDWPSSAYWREQAAYYPDAKVILTLRDPDRWFDSTQATIFNDQVNRRVAEDTPWARMARKIIDENTFGGRLADRAHATAVYRRHNEAVRAALPPERLLVYEVREGWAPLCDFLGVPVPETPFPAVNSTDEFRQRQADRAAAETQTAS